MTRQVAGLVIAGAALLAPLGTAAAPSSGNGFFFGLPEGGLSVRAGYSAPRAASDLFTFNTRQLALSKSDFTGPAVEVDLTATLNPRLDLVFGSGYSRSRALSDFRDWEDGDGQPIEQVTTFQRIPFSAGLRYFLTPRGESIGRFAFIPASYALYTGAGVGGMWYSFRQTGSFINFETLDVFDHTFRSSGVGLMTYGSVGADFNLSPRVALNTQARYMISKAGLSDDWVGFKPIDLSGLSVTAGFHIRF
jgi:hypothetical protein